VEGTILTVLREAAGAAASTDTPAGEDLAEFLLRVYTRAEQALAETPELLPVLKQAGVVDAGGAGFLLLLVAFLEEVTGEEVALPEAIFRAAAVHLVPAAESGRDISTLRYEVMFLLRSDDETAGDRLRTGWDQLGDSIVVVGDGGVWNCHVHTDHIGAAIEAGTALGRPERIKVTDLLEQAADEALHREETAFTPRPEFATQAVGVVAVAMGSGVVELFRDAGVQGVVVGGQTMNPSVRDVLAVVDAVAAQTVVVLPNNKNIIPVARQLDGLSAKTIHVVPTRSIPEGLAAMLAFMPKDDPARTVAAMEAAAAGCGWGEVTRAVRDATTPAGVIRAGDWLGIVDGEVRVIAPTTTAAAVGVLASLVNGAAEVVTVITGAEAEAAVTEAITGHLATHAVAVTVVSGGQPLYPYLFGVE
jgi:hypothetical protein